jgi:hypothetical protein
MLPNRITAFGNPQTLKHWGTNWREADLPVHAYSLRRKSRTSTVSYTHKSQEALMNRSPEQTLLVNLRRILVERFNEDELRTLCFELGIDWDDFPGTGKQAKTREVVSYCEHRRTIPLLVSKALELRPDILTDLLTESVFSPIEDTGRVPFADLDTYIYFFDIRRCALTPYYIRWTEAASRIDIITMSMQAVLDNYGYDRLVEWLMAGKNFRVLLLSPSSEAARIREKEEGISVANKIVTQIEALKACIYERTQKQIADKGQAHLGSLEVRFYEGIPYFAYFGTENEIVIGLYYAQKQGLQSEVFLVNNKSPIHKDFQSHFSTLWGEHRGISLEDRLVCVVSASGSRFMDVSRLK